MNNSKRIYRAAIYVRLSKEDGDLDDVRKAESNSISNQKSLILNYLKDKEDIEIVSIREDDGYSGATFDRPAFKLMMQDVKDGIIDCIVVKDLSRFAREYIDAGRYIERMFPAMGIRFIAINDAYDSADTQAQGNEIIIPFKNLINDAYCRDISIKIRSHLETKRQNGEFVGNYCVYGYKKSEIDHNVIVPDEYAGPVVQDIFHWIKNGMSLDAISDKLNALGILSPMAYKDSCNCLPVKVDDIYAAVLAVIKEQIQVFIDREKILKEHHNDSSVIRQEQVYTEAVNKCVKEMDRLMELKSGLYADYTEDLLDEKEYLQLNREYSQRIEKLKIQADEYRQAASQYESAEKTVAQLKAEMLRFKGKRKLTQEMVDLFVAQVRIYENKNLEIVLNYEDELKKFAELNMEREAG